MIFSLSLSFLFVLNVLMQLDFKCSSAAFFLLLYRTSPPKTSKGGQHCHGRAKEYRLNTSFFFNEKSKKS